MQRTTLDSESAPDAVVAVYATDAGAPGALIITDVAGAATLGAALTSMPQAIVESVRRSGVLDDPTLIENLGEVANVLSQNFNTADTPHLRYREVVALDAVDAEVRALLEAPAARRDVLVTVEGYGGGRISFVVA